MVNYKSDWFQFPFKKEKDVIIMVQNLSAKKNKNFEISKQYLKINFCKPTLDIMFTMFFHYTNFILKSPFLSLYLFVLLTLDTFFIKSSRFFPAVLRAKSRCIYS